MHARLPHADRGPPDEALVDLILKRREAVHRDLEFA